VFSDGWELYTQIGYPAGSFGNLAWLWIKKHTSFDQVYTVNHPLRAKIQNMFPSHLSIPCGRYFNILNSGFRDVEELIWFRDSCEEHLARASGSGFGLIRPIL